MSALRCVAVVAALLCVVSVAAAAPPATPAPRFAIDLNTDPLHRYDAVVPFFQGKFQAVIDYFDHIVPPALQPYLDPVLAKFDDYLPAEYAQEIRGIAQLAGVDLGKLVAMNLIYELTAYCTSIVAQDPNGSIYHSRNLDYDIPGLANLTVTFDFQQNNVTVYSCTTFAGYIGCLTGVRANAFSVSVNERDDGSGILKSIYAFLEGGKSIGMFLRSTLATVTSFGAALNNVTNTILVAPVYITMGGVKAGEGAIVTRNRTEVDNLWRIDAASGQWFILETNDDHWKPPADGRRDAANKSMNSLGQNSLDSKGLYNVLSVPPVFNPTTVYTTSMMAAHGTCDSMVRWDIPTVGERPVRSVSAKLKV